MLVRRFWAALAITLLWAAGARAQTYPLIEAPLRDAYFQIELNMTVQGEVRVQQAGKPVVMKQTARAGHKLVERVLEVGKEGLADKTARLYRVAKADLSLEKESSERVFREEGRLMVAQRVKDKTLAYCPKASLSREEIELTEHFDTLGLSGLVPGKEVKIGESWKVTNAAAQTLLELDGLISHDLVCTLDKVQDGLAQVSVKGSVTGIDLGASVKSGVAASYQFDLKSRRLTALEWKQSDQREQGPVSPAFKGEITTKVTRTPLEEPINELGDLALVGVPGTPLPPERATQVGFADAQGRYQLVHSRDWYQVGRSPQQAVFRLMERGDFVAQLTVTVWQKAEAGKHLSLDEFKEAMAQAPGWELEEILDKEKDSTVESSAGYTIYRLSAAGVLEGTKVVQYYYLVAGPLGDQVVLTFTMAPAQAQKLNTRDLSVVRGLTLPGTATP
jgi:hypothetical protein